MSFNRRELKMPFKAVPARMQYLRCASSDKQAKLKKLFARAHIKSAECLTLTRMRDFLVERH
jgi:hypothetical protein